MPSNNSNKTKHTILVTIYSLALIIFANGAYWVFSDIQQRCYSKVQQADFSKDALSTYEKCSMYTINLAICAFGYPLSREATIQQIFTLFPTSKLHEWHSRGLFNNPKTQTLMVRYPDATKDHPVTLWYGDYSIRNLGNIRCALAANGCYLYKEDGKWIITPEDNRFIYPNLRQVTYIGPFKVHEGLIYYMQQIGWLYVPRYKWIYSEK